MNKTYKTLLKQIGGLWILLSLVMVFPAIVASIYSEWYAVSGFLVAALITGGMGYLLYRVFFKNVESPKNNHALLIAASGWLSLAIMGALPFVFIAYFTPEDVMETMVPPGVDYESSLLYFRNPLHAVFESMSALTTTGLTMAVHEPSVGKGILFYRSLSQWVGGAGFIVMALAVFKQTPGQAALFLYDSESSGEKLKPNVIGTSRAIWKLYLGITLFVSIYLFIGTWWLLPEYPVSEIIFDSINHAMSAQSTGGFSTLDDSIAGYQSAKMEILYLLPMIMGALSIPFYFRLVVQKKIGEFRNDIQTRALLIAFVLGSTALMLLLMHSGSVDNPALDGVFQFVSALSTTGWQTSDIGSWDDVSIVFIITTAMLIGGAAGATVGGIKVIRVILIQKGVQWQINKIFLSPRAMNTVRINGKMILPEDLNKDLAQASTFAFIYLLLILGSTMITSFYMEGEYSLSQAFFEAASAQGTVGLSTGISGPEMPVPVEITYILQMWAGRLELFPILALFRALIYGTRPGF